MNTDKYIGTVQKNKKVNKASTHQRIQVVAKIHQISVQVFLFKLYFNYAV